MFLLKSIYAENSILNDFFSIVTIYQAFLLLVKVSDDSSVIFESDLLFLTRYRIYNTRNVCVYRITVLHEHMNKFPVQ